MPSKNIKLVKKTIQINSLDILTTSYYHYMDLADNRINRFFNFQWKDEYSHKSSLHGKFLVPYD
jgi:hypothetical protein